MTREDSFSNPFEARRGPHDQATSKRRDGRKTTINDPAQFLHPTYYIDRKDALVRHFASDHTQGATTDLARAVGLFYAVRDCIRHDPYSVRFDPACFRASDTLRRGAGWCVPKAVLLAAACRAAGVPARLGYADVRNHLATPRLRALSAVRARTRVIRRDGVG